MSAAVLSKEPESLRPDDPRVSVIMPVYNGERYLRAALRSALAQTFASFEVIVIDDGSTDRSGEIAREFASRHPHHVKYFAQRNVGLVAARNAAIAQSSGRYLALLDCDDVWMPDHLAQAVEALDADPNTVLVHADVRFIDEHGTVIRDVRKRSRWNTGRDDPFRAILLRYQHVACPTAVFRKDCAIAVDGFDARYNKLGCEDRDLWLRLALRGRVRYLDYLAADYRTHSESMSCNLERMLQARTLLTQRMRDFPQGSRLYRAARSAVALSEAEECSRDTEIARVLRSYARAICLRPVDLRAWRGLLSTLVAPVRRRRLQGKVAS